LDCAQLGSGLQLPKNVSSKQQLGPTQVSVMKHPPAQTQGGIDMSGAPAQVAAQVPLQQVCPIMQVVMPHLQAPFTQVEPVPQLVPQPPQLLTSDMRLLHPWLPQQLCPVPQIAPVGAQPHLPLTQMVPLAHCVPQPPQLCGSIAVMMHTSPQQVPLQKPGLSGQTSRLPRSGCSGTPELPLLAQAASSSTRTIEDRPNGQGRTTPPG
jgi:hypothetical protein